MLSSVFVGKFSYLEISTQLARAIEIEYPEYNHQHYEHSKYLKGGSSSVILADFLTFILVNFTQIQNYL